MRHYTIKPSDVLHVVNRDIVIELWVDSNKKVRFRELSLKDAAIKEIKGMKYF
jgi:hypothetical protein